MCVVNQLIFNHFHFKALNSKKSLPVDNLPVILHNVACYLDCLPLEAGLGPGSGTWSALLTQLEMLFRRLILLLSSLNDVTPLFRIMVSVLRVPGISSCKVNFILYYLAFFLMLSLKTDKENN